MSKTIFIRPYRESEYQWFADGAVLGQGGLDQLKDGLGQLPGARLRLLLPGDKVLLNQLPCSGKERRHLRKAAPYELEESLVSSVEDLHFAFSPPANDKATAACCDHQWLESQLAPFQEAGMELHHMVPEPLALRYDASEETPAWVLRLVGDSVWVRYGHSQGLSLESDLAAIALQQLLAEQGEPEQILLLADTENEIAKLQNLLPESLRENCESRLETLPQSLKGEASSGPVLDMRQGDFSNHLPVGRWWLLWKKLAILAAVVLVVFAVSQWMQYSELKEQNVQVRQQIAETVTDALSRRAVGLTQRQLNILKSELRKQRGNGLVVGASATALLADVVPVFANSKGVVLDSINLTGKTGELRISCWAPSLSTLQALQAELGKRQFEAKLKASADGEGQRGSFQIKKISVKR